MLFQNCLLKLGPLIDRSTFLLNLDPQQDLNLPEELKAKLMEVTAHAEKMTEGFNLGDMIQVKGKLKTFRNMREIVASAQSIL